MSERSPPKVDQPRAVGCTILFYTIKVSTLLNYILFSNYLGSIIPYYRLNIESRNVCLDCYDA